jgi:hypothetical protein
MLSGGDAKPDASSSLHPQSDSAATAAGRSTCARILFILKNCFVMVIAAYYFIIYIIHSSP